MSDQFEKAQETKEANVVCMKWGPLYGPEWVNKLYGMVKRNTTWNIRFVCLTDDPAGIRPEVECLPFPELPLDPEVGRRWRKLTLYSNPLHDLTGLTLYYDIDLVILRNIDDLFTYPGRFCMMQIWRHQRFGHQVGNSSVVRLIAGAESHIIDRFLTKPHRYWDELYRTPEQRFVTETVGDVTFYPEEWLASFKDTLPRNGLIKLFSRPKKPAEAKIVVFYGANTPADAIHGRIDPTKSPSRRDTWIKRRFRPADWVEEAWRE